MKNYYQIIGVEKSDADDAFIRMKYRELALTYHPDVCNEQDAASKFIEINEAYRVLSDPYKKERYDVFYDKYFLNDRKPEEKENIHTDLSEVIMEAHNYAAKRAKVRYEDLIREMDCHFSNRRKADGKPCKFKSFLILNAAVSLVSSINATK